MRTTAQLIDAVLRTVEIISDAEYRIDQSFQDKTNQKVEELCSNFPMR
jgi:uncharacterized protein with HEPN domain